MDHSNEMSSRRAAWMMTATRSIEDDIKAAADWRDAAIRSGEISFDDLIDLAEERLERLRTFYDTNVPFMVGEGIKSIEDIAVDLRASFEARASPTPPERENEGANE